ncbi:hypothetical protein DFH09DRAFT_1149950 [Mycena vulgaris]|nr:hypothetical protein DFH09DRAFT_1149950 [Mycena vulgaris]
MDTDYGAVVVVAVVAAALAGVAAHPGGGHTAAVAADMCTVPWTRTAAAGHTESGDTARVWAPFGVVVGVVGPAAAAEATWGPPGSGSRPGRAWRHTARWQIAEAMAAAARQVNEPTGGHDEWVGCPEALLGVEVAVSDTGS